MGSLIPPVGVGANPAASEGSGEVEMSVEERARLEMQENAVNMAREHPEDVAQLIRTWLVEG